MKTSVKQGVSTVVEHDLALKVYLDALLDEPRVESETQTAVQTQVEVPAVEVAPAVKVPAAERVTQEVAREVSQTEAAGPESDYPAWAQAEFEVLMFKVDRERVRWRSDRSQRPWLAGTLVEQMCALIDVDVFAEMLKKGGLADEIGQ